ncbi:MAG TPA: succinate dehydrogenase [Casimicrobiaceae bacterium]|nr:succinate dehydrogenase [Casimicrobiaceae bacterium]
MSSMPRELGLDWRARGHSGWWAFALHRVSGVALTLFLPAHFYVLSRALTGAASLDAFLRWTDQPLVRASEIVLVFLLGAHLAGGLRLLFIEFRGWRAAWQPGLVATVIGVAAICALTFALNLTPHP